MPAGLAKHDNLPFRVPFLEYDYTVPFANDILCSSKKYVWFGAWYKQRVQIFFSPEFDNEIYQALQ